MRILILNQFFYPDHSATSQLMTDLAEDLVARGFDVTALASRGRYNGGARLARREHHKGVAITRAWATSFGKGNLICRLSDYFSFYLGASCTLLRLPRHDVVMALTTPPLIGLIAIAIARIKGSRVVSLMQDIYPDVAVQLGALSRDGLLTRTLDRLTRFLLKHSDRIIVLGECMKERIAEKLGQAAMRRVDVIHNWADGDAIRPVADNENQFIADNALEGRFLVMFSGNLGRVNEFQTLLEAARLLHHRTDIVFLFIGEGARRAEIARFVERNNLSNVRLLPYQPRQTLPHSLAAGHASVVTLADGLAGLSVPSKIYAILAAGRPILFVGDPRSTAARIVLEHQIALEDSCGNVVISGDGAAFARIIEYWAADPNLCQRMGQAARALFERRFERRIAVDAYVASLSKCIDAPDAPRVAAEMSPTAD